MSDINFKTITGVTDGGVGSPWPGGKFLMRALGTFDGGALTLEWSDKPTSGFAPLYSLTEAACVPLWLPEGFVRAQFAGGSSPEIDVLIRRGASLVKIAKPGDV